MQRFSPIFAAAMTQKKKILVVDDEETLCEAVGYNLEAAGYLVETAYSAEEALALDLPSFSLILLDIMMGDISGIQLAQILKKRKDTSHIPIIFCTARDSDEDMISGLDLGADDYITKPYSIGNLMARVRSVLRRSGDAAPVQVATLRYDSLEVDTESKKCLIDGEEVKMPRKEFEILKLLISHPGRIFSREEILSAAWPDEVVVLDRVVDVNITRLRSKLGRYGRLIITKTGYGYGFSL